MINFQSLALVIHKSYSFVGIEKQANQLYFYLPKGFIEEIDSLDTFSGKRDTFFLFYKIFHTFKEICKDKGYLKDSSELGTSDRDGLLKSSSGSVILNRKESSNIFYSKLDLIGSLLGAFDEPKILALAYRLGKSEKLDISKIDRYLHQAVYLPNNAAYVDQITLPRRAVKFDLTDIVTLYCYLFYEIKQQLNEVVSDEITALAERYRQNHLSSQDSLFHEQSYEQVLDILKDSLEAIDHNTPIKDVDYWQYYEAIELFLYGDWTQAENGEIWGIKDFHSVWESMCLNHLAQTITPKMLLHLDTQYVTSNNLDKVKIFPKILDIDVRNTLQVNGARFIPDAIVLQSALNQINLRKTYRIGAWNSWNDYGYTTLITNVQEVLIRVAYVGQPPVEHTINKIQEIYPKDTNGATLVSSRLPDNFYSFWETPNQISIEDLTAMHHFNHLFYIALERQIKNWNDFQTQVFHPLNIFFNPRTGSIIKNNVFTDSLLRDTRNTDVQERFENFVQRNAHYYKTWLEIIDIKYLTLKYFRDPNNIEEIKRRSVRKQFVYEYLVQRSLERQGAPFNELSIQSKFWLPSYRPNDSALLEETLSFMSSYLDLVNVNFAMLAETYLA